ncbi:Spectinomycin tetracycline efflux pump [Providencia rustigianii]|uniref:Spectinomycin tetracycline efflux pump n=1 Tax=Providencia rustigianii TaxID=158850 RepID=A0A379G6M8_9GAMM|nr:MFS transporter [Providencia rustigianii]SUC36699.1 Spectinomycin tetracycline efflux pump [Providencia rustigianii]VEB74749.1 Spectinomycin tetracycline efflux pump [Providencia rustigianii]
MKRIFLIVAVCLGTFMATLDISIVNVALPAISQELNANLSMLQWIIDSYALCLSALILSVGPISDRYGRKKVWLTGIVIFTVGSLICAFSLSAQMLLFGRVIQGIAAAALIPGALSIITQAFSNDIERIKVIGIWSAVSALSLIIGPILGGFLVDTFEWSFIFMINLPIGLLTLLLGGLGIKESADPDKAALDPLGQLLSVVALAGLTYGLIEAGDMGWTSLPTIAGLMIGGIAAFGFVIVELNVPRPLLPIFLFKQNPYFLQYNLASFALGFATYSNVFFIALFLQKGQGWGAFEAGLRMAPEFIAMALFSFSFGRLSRTLSVRNIMVIGFLLIATASMLLTRVNSDTEYLPIAAILFIFGAGMGMATPAIGALVMASVEKAYSGIASAVMNALRQTGMTLGIALLGTLMTHRAIEQLMEDPQISRLLSEGEVDGLIKGSVAASSHFIEQATQSAFVSGFNLAMLGGAISIMLCLALMMKTSQIVRGK